MANIIDVSTGDNLQYQFFPLAVNFKVKAAKDAHIALTTAPQEAEPIYEVIIGGWSNTRSVIRRNKQKPDVVATDTPGILDGGEFRGFWVRWDSGIISAGREGEAIPFISWQDPEPFPISFVGVCTGWGATGAWKIGGLTPVASGGGAGLTPVASGGGGGAGTWVDSSRGQVPPGAVQGGHDSSGEPLFVARAQHKKALIPGKLVASHGCVYVAWKGQEHAKTQYQVLVGGPNNWVSISGSNIPPSAFPGGESEDGETLFVGRVRHEGSITIGKVQKSHGACNIAFGGKELAFPDYEILIS